MGIRVTAAPEGGKANAAAEKVIAERLGIAKSLVRVVRGHTSRIKHVEVQGMDQPSVESALGIDPALW